MNYCDLGELSQYLDIGDASDNALLGQCIERATAILDMKCRRTLCSDTDSIHYFTVGLDTEGYNLYFDTLYSGLTQILNGDTSATAVTSAQYVTLPYESPYYGVKIKRSAGVIWQYSTDPENAIKVTGRRSFFSAATVGAVPDDVKHFTIRLAAFLYRQKDSSLDIDRPLLTDAGVTMLPPDLANDIKLLVNAYGRKGV